MLLLSKSNGSPLCAKFLEDSSNYYWNMGPDRGSVSFVGCHPEGTV
jgi:hypothetical protein